MTTSLKSAPAAAAHFFCWLGLFCFADAIESLILLLDEIDGDVEHEEDADFENEPDMEPSLGATNGINQERALRSASGEIDAEHEHEGREPDAEWEPDGTPFVLVQS